MLKAWLQNPNLSEMFVEEKYHSWVSSLHTDRHVTVTLFQLEKMYGTTKEAQAFIAELCRGQSGTPHPQAPQVAKARMFKVLKEVVDETSKGESSSSGVSISGRVSESKAKELLKKQLGGLGDGIGNFLDMKTGAIKSKKPKKEKTAEEEAIAEVKKLEKKKLGTI
ncbi:unnamed protein product [Durusdinium trenchii]|uniref:Uncharacterized protein n=1 Tax=Durusdinium trenchii TaxID=1381693 RepID=A0ABP0MDK8_9DINO